MAVKGKKISQDYIIPEMDIVTIEFKSKFSVNAPSSDDINEYKDKWQNAIANGLFKYISNEYAFDVKTNGVITLSPPPPGATLPVVNYAVDGNITIFSSDMLFNFFKSNILSTTDNALDNMKSFFDSIFTWLPKVANITGPVNDITVNPVSYLSTITGLGTIIFPNFLSSILATNCINETSSLVFVDENGNPTGKSYMDVWDIIGNYIYQGLDGNIIATIDVGTPNTSQVINGIAYTGVSTGTVTFN